MNEFKLYNRIINGDLRPHLKSYDNINGLRKIEKEFFSSEIIVDETLPDNLLRHFPAVLPSLKDGDEVNLTIDDTTTPPQITITLIPNEKEEALINLDIPPPPDAKSELFLMIIELEYERIKEGFLDFFNNAKDAQSVSFYASQNIQMAKIIAKDAHTLKKKIKTKENDEFDNPNVYVIEVVKKYLIYLLIDIQTLFNPFITFKLQNEDELEDELFEGYHSKMKKSVRSLSDKMNDIYIARLLKELGEDATPIQIRDFFIEKLVMHKAAIKEKKGYINNHDYDLMRLYTTQIAKVSEQIYTAEIFIPDKIDLLEKYEKALETITKLRLNTDSIEYKALAETDFFQKMQIQLDSWKELISLSYTAPVKENIFRDLQNSLLTIQSRKNLSLTEDQWNDYICDLLRMQKYYIADQSRSGNSGSSDKRKATSGELDITIRDISNNGNVKTIIETLKIESCGKKDTVIKMHIDKLLNRYDTGGNKENFIIILSYAKNFSKLWDAYKFHISDCVIKGDTDFVELDPISHKADLKTGYNTFKRNNQEIRLYHLFLNMNND
ncbi:hypothetical protein [Sphingobacterium kyonggiense]